jgi:hypothetical protein
VASLAPLPLTLALSPEYRGEGQIQSRLSLCRVGQVFATPYVSS